MKTRTMTLLSLGALLASTALAGTLPAPKVGEMVTLAPKDGSGFQDRPGAAYGKDCYLVAWQDGADGFGEDPNILAARVSKDGKLLDSKPIEICKAERAQRRPRVAWSDAAKTFLVVWEDQRGGPAFDVYAARVSPDGKCLDPDGFAVAANRDHNQCFADVAAAPGGFVVVWMEYWTFPVWGVFGARVSGGPSTSSGQGGKVLDPQGVALRTGNPAKKMKKQHEPWEQKGYLFPRLASRGGRVWMSYNAPAGIGQPLMCIELACGGKLAVTGKEGTPIFGFTGPKGYGLAAGPDGQVFGTGTANGERGGGHERIYFSAFTELGKAPKGSAPAKLRAQQPWHNTGRVFGSFTSGAAFDGKHYWVVYGFGHAPDAKAKRPTVSDIRAFRVDPKEHMKALDLEEFPVGRGKAKRGAIVIANAPTFECHPAVTEGPPGELLFVYANDKGADDCRIEARVVKTR